MSAPTSTPSSSWEAAHPRHQGTHLTADLAGCAASHPWMSQPDLLRAACLQAVARVGLQAVGERFHGFEPAQGHQTAGVTGVVLLAESHLAVHTWPEIDAVTLDVYVCNFGADNSAKAHQVIDTLLAAFAPASVSRQALQRGAAPALERAA